VKTAKAGRARALSRVSVSRGERKKAHVIALVAWAVAATGKKELRDEFLLFTSSRASTEGSRQAVNHRKSALAVITCRNAAAFSECLVAKLAQPDPEQA
jgi:hypothetical protein